MDSVYEVLDLGELACMLTATLCVYHGARRSLENPFDAESADGPVQVTMQMAVLAPLVASLALLVVYFFFEYIQFFYICTCICILGWTLYLLLVPLADRLLPRKAWTAHTVDITLSQIGCGFLAVAALWQWVTTAHWLAQDLLAFSMCVYMLSFVRIPSLKVATMLFVGLLLYDVWWVFFSARVFESNVMVSAASKQATNPVNVISQHLALPTRQLPGLSLPGVLLFPSQRHPGRLSMLGLGDIFLPGLLVALNLRHEMATGRGGLLPHLTASAGTTPAWRSPFRLALGGYVLGLLVAMVMSHYTQHPQPALLYLVPATLLPTLYGASRAGQLADVWNGQSLLLDEDRRTHAATKA
eukprot:m.185615 g.185615  ORF g.185615 m.185615 type:complete len:356 (-) comp21581_c0_seq2:23-1090(-)